MKNIFKPADILIPAENIDLQKWSVVACDQYTSEPEYWETVEQFVGDKPSSLKITLPEIYLEHGDVDKRVLEINKNMHSYLKNNVFKTIKNSFIYIKRTLKNKKIRHGLIGVLDLEAYDFNKNSASPIRATEGTVLSRIPPRIKIRENAPLELPHIMVLIDDDKKTVIEPLEDKLHLMNKLYDFQLMQNSGTCVAYQINEGSEICRDIQASLDKLGETEHFKNKYKIDANILQYAMGDGNHSLATAKSFWDMNKERLGEDSPARYALIELVNLHDESLEFEPIHRIVFDIKPEHLMQKFCEFYPDAKCTSTPLPAQEGAHNFKALTENGIVYITIPSPSCNLAVGSLQNFIDFYVDKFGGKVDYIHGEKSVEASISNSCIGFLLPVMQKNELFTTVIKDGVLPRKTFSMGHAEDKRFYLEARKII